MTAVRLFCAVAGLVCVSATFDAGAQAALRGYDPQSGQTGDSGQAALQGYAPPPAAPSSDQSQSSGDWPHDADDDRPMSWQLPDSSDHSLPSGPYDAPQNEASAQPTYQQQYVPPRSPLDVARANCNALRARLEAVMRAEMQGGNPAAMNQYAAERAAIYQQELQTGCE
jgi:hypothetical protein